MARGTWYDTDAATADVFRSASAPLPAYVDSDDMVHATPSEGRRHVGYVRTVKCEPDRGARSFYMVEVVSTYDIAPSKAEGAPPKAEDARENAIERLAEALVYGGESDTTEALRYRARALLDTLGLVAVDPALVARLRQAQAENRGALAESESREGGFVATSYGDACSALADAVLAQTATVIQKVESR